jgi:hypothetical protein
MTKPDLTVDEIIASLNHSSLPTIIVEGKEDIIVLRKMEHIFQRYSLSIMVGYGKVKALEIFRRRSEIRTKILVAVIVDMDLWVFSGVPVEYQSDFLITTDGFSIENDAFRDAKYDELMFPPERRLFLEDIQAFVKWYTLQIHAHKTQNNSDIARDPISVIQNDSIHIDERQDGYPLNLFCQILNDYKKLVRGKSLMRILMQQLSARHRSVKHRSDVLLEIAAHSGGKYINGIFEKVSLLLAKRS